MRFRRLTAELVTEDIPGTIEYYTRTLGLELDSTYPHDAPVPQWVQFKCNNDYIMPFPQFAIKDINGYILLFGQLE